jgi:hypothetical protein
MKLLERSDTWLGNAKNRHRGERCFVIGNGPSLKKCDLSLIGDDVSFGVNGIFLHPDFRPTYYVTISCFFWEEYVEQIRNVRCVRRILPTDLGQLDSDVPTSWINFRRPKYFSENGEPLSVPMRFSTHADRIVYGGGTVLFACLQLAYHMGFNEAILLGVDHDYGQKEDRTCHGGYYVPGSEIAGSHFTENYFSPETQVHLDLPGMERGYTLAKEAFERSGRRIVNATPGSKLTVYPMVDYLSLF